MLYEVITDPETFREDSTIGVAGLMRAWKKGNVALANAPGAGVADDNRITSYNVCYTKLLRRSLSLRETSPDREKDRLFVCI